MDLLSVQDLTTLLNLLNQEEKSLEYISTTFKKTFPKIHHFSVGCALYLLLQDKLLFQPSTRLAAFYILYDLYNSEPLASNPFLPIFIETLQKGNKNKQSCERTFIISLLSSPSKDVTRKSPKEIITSFDRNIQLPVPDLNSLKKLYLERQPPLVSPFRRSGVSPLLHDSAPVSSNPSNYLTTTDNNLNDETKPPKIPELISQLNLRSFEPTISRPIPPLFPPGSDEVLWLNPDLTDYKICWDLCVGGPLSGMVGEGGTSGTEELRKLMQKAFDSSLMPAQQQNLLTELEKDVKRVYQCGLSPQKLPALVEHNPLIAIEVLLKLMNSAQITEYFCELVNMDMSLHSMEVVNRLTTLVELPTEFVHLYIAKCISSCKEIKDRRKQHRLVRLVCVFLQSLIQNKIINVKDLFYEVQAFCLDFPKVREAAVLFRLLKSLEN